MASREYGAAIFSPGLGEILLIKHTQESGWAFPFSHTTESDVHVVAAASAVRQLLGVDIGDKISRTHWIEVEFPETGALVRLYVALGIRPETATPHCVPGAVAQWHPLRSILPPVNAILRTDTGGACVHGGDAGDDEEGGSLMLEAGIAPFLAKLKALLNKHPEWRIAQLDPHLTRLIQAAMALPTNQPTSQQQPELNKSTHTTSPKQDISASQSLPPPLDQQQHAEQPQAEAARQEVKLEEASGHADNQLDGSQTEEAAGDGTAAAVDEKGGWPTIGVPGGDHQPGREVAEPGPEAARQGAGGNPMQDAPGGTPTGDSGDGGEGEGSGSEDASGWRGPRPQEHLMEYCRMNGLPEPCYSLVVKKSARRPLVTASCILSHIGVTITPDMHVPGGINAACQAAALAALLWLEGALPADGGEAVRVVPVGWPPLLSEARGEAWEAAQVARKAGGARRELDTAQREALLREMDKKRQRLVEEAAELERLMAALRGGEGVAEPDISRLAAELGLDSNGGNGGGGDRGTGVLMEGGATAASPARRSRGAKRSADGGDANGDGTGSLTVGLRALQFRSGSDHIRRTPVPCAGGGGWKGAGGRAPGTKRPREDGGMPGVQGGEGTPVKSVVMELKEFCDRKRWPQPQYSYSPGAGPGAAAVVKLPPVAGLGDFSSGPQSNRKRAKEAAAAAALAQLSALGLK
ncbi:hypothetical protein Vafri_7178 [Volvox africanus]|uniref:DRBM domain-containing protein n=1 Tax=Volvox africanus TaxID=51714 RepID=A0A8J4AZT5_9CHLO|nr:hypothetical protein Vafri_7178 [Volvox africanus]